MKDIDSPIPWVGGKKALRDEIIARIPDDHERYIEPFGGAGWVLFAKPKIRFEVYNDRNGFLPNLFCCMQIKPAELKNALGYVLNSREVFQHVKKQLADWPTSFDLADPDVKAAALFAQQIRFSYAASLKSFGAQPCDIRQMFALIDKAYDRLAGVIIENRDFETIIRQYDQPDAFLLVDPPYYGAGGFYKIKGKSNFDLEDHIRLRDRLLASEGRFLLTYNDHPAIRELYDHPGIHTAYLDRLHNFTQRYNPGEQYSELFIANYDMEAVRRGKNTQLSLFGSDSTTLH